MTKRHPTAVDLWKGLAILSVLNVQTILWAGALNLPNWMRHVAPLIDVPLFFFVSGYLLHNADRRGIANRTLRQVARLVVDYAVVGFIAFAIAVVWRASSGLEPMPDIDETIGSFFVLRPHGPIWSMWPAFGGSLGFLRDYLSILPLAIVALCLPMKGKRMLFLIVSFSAFLLIVQYGADSPPFILSDARSVLFCLTLFLAGALFKRMRDRFSVSNLLLVWLGFVAATMLACFQAGGWPDLQAAKIPPTSVCLLFSSHAIMAFCLMATLEQRGRLRPARSRLARGICWCGESAFRIYLWQGLVVTASMLVIPELMRHGWPTAVIYVAVLVWNVAASLAITFCHNGVEAVVMSLSKGKRLRYTQAAPIAIRGRRKTQDKDIYSEGV